MSTPEGTCLIASAGAAASPAAVLVLGAGEIVDATAAATVPFDNRGT